MMEDIVSVQLFTSRAVVLELFAEVGREPPLPLLSPKQILTPSRTAISPTLGSPRHTSY